MKSLTVAFCVALACGDVRVQADVWQPAAGHAQIPIRPGFRGTQLDGNSS